MAPTGTVELEGALKVGTATYGVLPPGPRADRFAMTVTLPEGWTGADGWVLRKNGGVENREGAENFIRTAEAVNLSRADVIQLAKNSFNGSFLDRASIASPVASIDAYAATH
jgi:hypothetical protein